MRSKLRAGVIGVGTFGSLHARVYAELEAADLVAVADIKPERMQHFISQYGTRGYADYNELLEKEDLDIVSVCTSDELHLEPVMAAAAAGKHILVEKPLAMSVSDCDAMIQAAEKAKVKLMVGQILRFDPRYYTARQAIADGQIGTPVHFFARRNNPIRNARRLGICRICQPRSPGYGDSRFVSGADKVPGWNYRIAGGLVDTAAVLLRAARCQV